MSVAQRDIFHSFHETVQKSPEKTAILFKDGSDFHRINFSQLYSKVLQTRHLLREQGIVAGDRVVLLLSNTVDFPIVFFALMSLDAVAVPLDVQYEKEQVAHFSDHCQTKMIITTLKYATQCEDSGHLNVLLIDQIKWEDKEYGYDGSTHNLDQLAVLFYTSGTTAEPKGVKLSQRNILANYDAFVELNIVSDKDSIISVLPLHHAYAFNATMLTPLLLGSTISFPGSLSSQALVVCMREAQSTIMIGVPQLFTLLHRSISEKLQSMNGFVKSIAQISGLLKRRLRNQFGGHLHTMVCGGAQMDVRIMHDFQGWGFCFLEGYGLSETAPVVSFNFKDNQKIGSVGKPLPGVDVRINQPDEKGYGEVCVKGPNVMMGYYEDKIQTDKVLSDGWFQTGDIGFLDEEGYLYLTGRMKEMIVLPSGKNIFPHEIESLYEASPFIQEIGVVEYDKELVCVISPNNEHFKAEGLAQIRDRLLWEVDTISGNLPSYQRLKGFAITTDPLPRTRLGKLQRYQLPELYKALKEDKHERSAEKGIEDLENYKKKAVGMIEARLDKKVQLADHLELDLGLDSLNKVEMLLELQEGLGLQLDDDTLESFFMCGTVQELLYALEKSGGNSCDNSDGDVKECEINWANVLNDELDDKTKSRIKLEFGFFSTTFNFGVILLVKIIVKMCFLLEVKGRDNLPKDGAYLLCPNHVSYLDAFFIIAALPFKVVVKTYFLGIDKFFKNTIVSPFIRQFRLIPIEVNYNLVNALGACGYVYKNGKNACYFAEGQRSIDGNIKEFKKGIGILTKEFDTTVVPVYIAGGFKVWPRNQKWPRLAKVSVSFGDVWRPQEVLDGNEDQNDYVILAENLRQKVATLG